MVNNKYIIITPAKNEEKYIALTIESVIRQTIVPALWIIVNDGSNDKTAEIIREYSHLYDWIKLVDNNTRDEKRAGGPNVINAFYKGFNEAQDQEFDFITKLDADVILPENYFEVVSKSFLCDPKLGICGGYIVNINSKGEKKIEKTADFHVRGAFKSYRKECFENIGGLKPVYNWDGLDQVIAMYNSWKVKILPLEVIHQRHTSTLINRGLKKNFLMGYEYYRDGGDIVLTIIKAFVYGKRNYPKYISSVAFLIGYFKALILRPEKHINREVEIFFRKFQYSRLQKYIRFLKR